MGNLTHIVSGDIASFRSAACVPIESLKCHFLPKQDLHGYNNPWPVGGGENIWDEEWELGTFNTTTGEDIVLNTQIRAKNLIPISANTTYYFKSVEFVWILFYDQNKNVIENYYLSNTISTSGNASTIKNTTFLTPVNGAYMRFYLLRGYGTTYKNDISINKTSTNTSYSPYENICPIEGWNNITVHKVKKNLFNFDINNVEYDVPNDKGENRSIYHTGIIGDGRKISVSAILIDTELTSNTQINLGYLQNGTLYQTTSLIVWDTGVGYSRTVSIPIGQELLLVNAANSAYAWTRNMPRYNIQIEINDINTIFESYYDEQIPITFPVLGKNRLDPSTYYHSSPHIANGITFIKNNDNTITANGTCSDSEVYVAFEWIVPFTTNCYFCSNLSVPYATANIYLWDATLNARFKKWNGTTNSGASSLTTNLQEVQLIKGHKASLRCRVMAGATIENLIFYPMILLDSCTETAYEQYNSDNTIYGGYVDIAKGEVVATHILLENLWSEWTLHGTQTNTVRKYITPPYEIYSSSYYNYVSRISNIARYSCSWTELDETHFYVSSSTRIYMWLPIDTDESTKIQVLGTLLNPIHYPLSKTELKTFLDQNNIWSNANDITEVSYQIHDSNMIKETKNAMAAANNSHYKKIIWNQWCYPLNADNWAGYANDRVSVSFNNGIATSTWLTTDIGYSTSVRLNYNIAPSQITNDIWYGSYLVNPSKAGLKWGIEMCGGQQLTDDIVKPANEWSFCSFIAPVKRNNRNTIYISNIKTTNGSDIGMTAQAKAPIHINLTQMFGAGNEPTKAEFEHLCSLNNIDLTIYHPYDEGTELYWIFP